MMDLKQRFETDAFFNFNLVQIGVTVIGAGILFLFIILAAPSLTYDTVGFAIRGFLVAIGLGVVSVTINYRFILALWQFSRGILGDDPESAVHWESLRRGTYVLPRRFLRMTLILWPIAGLAIGGWARGLGIITFADAVRILFCGVLYAPIQGLILFYSVRYSMRRLAVLLQAAGQGLPEKLQKGLNISQKLMITFVCLAVIPLLAGVLINEVQRERSTVNYGLSQVCQGIELAHAQATRQTATSRARDGERPFSDSRTWQAAFDAAWRIEGLPVETDFQAALISRTDGSAMLFEGKLDQAAKKVWREVVKGEDAKSGGCRTLPIPGEHRFFVIRYFSDPGVWISAVTDPLPPSPPFWTRYGVTILLALIVIGVGIVLALLSATDVDSSIREMARAAGRAANRDFVQVSEFLPDDEMSELALGFNTLVRSIEAELSRSQKLIDEVREAIGGIGQQTSRIMGLVDRQRDVINEQSSLSREASSSSEEVTRKTSEIKERAYHTQSQMDEVSQARQEANDLLIEVSKVIDGIVQDSERLRREMSYLEMNYGRVEEVAKIIEEIAERTEILAMNASLEALGEAGQGGRFGVVASEIQRLSELISTQVVDMKRIMAEIRSASQEMSEAVQDGRHRASFGPEWTNRLGKSLEGFTKRASQASESMDEIVEMTERQSKAMEHMKVVISEIKSVSSVMKEVSSGAENAVQVLNDLAEHLRGMIREHLEKAPQPTERDPSSPAEE